MVPRAGNEDPEDPGVVEDLRDQSEWSSYTQDIPRVGNRYRESLRLGRYRRGFRNVSRPRRFLGSELWTIARITLIAAGVVLAISVAVVLLMDS